MRIALVTHKFAKGDGQGRVNYELARAALLAGHSVWLVASEVAPELAAHPQARAVRLAVSAVPTDLMRNQLFALRSTVWLWRNRGTLDLVHVNGFVSWGTADVNSSHFVHSAWLKSPHHSWQIRRNLNGLYQLLYSFTGRWLEQRAYGRAGCVVAVSEQVRRELLAAGVESTKIRVIQNGVDVEEFAPRADGGSTDGRQLLFVGDIKTPRKNLDTLLRALVLVPGARLAVVGRTAGSPYPRMARELGLADRVEFLGFRRDVAHLMQRADVFVFPSRYEACSLVLLEAAACGLAIVTARTTGGTEILSDGCGVLLQDAEDHCELAAALNLLVADRAKLRTMGAEARSVATRNSWQVMAERYLRLYREFDEQAGQERDAARGSHAGDIVV